MPDDTAPATQLTPAHADAIEIFAEVLAQSEEEGLGDDFYSRLCEGITRCTALRRVVIFRYDSARRRILAAGSFGVDLALFAGDFVHYVIGEKWRFAVPLIVGSAVLTGTAPRVTSAVWPLVAGVDGPAELVAVTATRRVDSMSACTTP